MKKNWRVKFRKLMAKEWNVVERPFKSKDSADFFVQTILMATPFPLEVESYEEEV